MQTQAAKERLRPRAPFRNKEWPRLIPYAGSTPHMRRKAVSPETSKVRPKKRRQLTSEIRHWFAAEIAVWPHDPQLPLTWENLVAKGAAQGDSEK